MSYTPQFEKEYEDGWEDFPSEDTLITAHSLNMYDGTFEHIEGYLEDHPIAQTTTMPTASEDELGHIYQYMGETTATFTQGYFYKCVSDEEEDPTYSWQNISVQSGGGGGSDVSITPTLSTGTKIADFEIDGVSGELYAPTGGGGGTNAQWTQTQTNGTKIAEITIDNVSQDVFDSTWSGTHAEYELVKNDIPNGTKIFFTDDAPDIGTIANDVWDSTKAYVIGDIVIYLNGLYRCVTANTGQNPTTAYWKAISLTDIAQPKVVALTDFITMEEGYTLVESHIFKHGYRVFGDICVKATTAYSSTIVTAGTINATYRPIWAFMPVCAMGTDEWASQSAGYCFISNNGLLRLGDQNSTGNKKAAKLHIDYMAYD